MYPLILPGCTASVIVNHVEFNAFLRENFISLHYPGFSYTTYCDTIPYPPAITKQHAS